MSDPRTLPLLVEVGCEEIPARFLAQAQKDFGERLRGALEEARLFGPESAVRNQEPESATSELRTPDSKTGSDSRLPTPDSRIRTYSTPRRLVVHVPALLERQPDRVEEVTGPPVKVAFDKDNKPTRAAESFAAKNGAKIEDLYRVTTPKGEYLAAKKMTHGRPALEVLGEILPVVITGLTFPKSMYWEETKTRWVRPIRWILALLGEGSEPRVIPFEVAGVKSGNMTFGQRTSQGRNPKLENRNSKTEIGPPHFAFRVSSFDDYAARLRQMGVEFDPAKRRERVRHQIKVLLEDSGFSILPDEDLEEWIVNSTEWPHALLGSFEERFLELPREILITVMLDHQHYFAVEDAEGNLQARFVTLLNVDGDPQGIIRHGHERVLTARFTDAEFFWNADQKVPLRERLPMLERVTYQAKLGSYADKLRRMEAILTYLWTVPNLLQCAGDSALASAHQAIRLAKCDLTTHMVQEFPELQGIIGGLYARDQGESAEVADAIYDQYLPQTMEDQCPRGMAGALVSFVDKFDSVLTGFGAGHAPTGSSDPFGLRRLGNGLVKIAIEFSLPISLRELTQSAYAFLTTSGKINVVAEEGAVLLFLEDRIRFYLESVRGIRCDTIRAVLAPDWFAPLLVKPRWNTPVDAFRRADAAEKIRDTEDFLALSQAAKRIRNILRQSKSSGEWVSGCIDPDLFQEEERRLWGVYEDAGQEAEVLTQGGLYYNALQVIAKLKPTVDNFFDKVLVMAEDPRVRQNRLRLLRKLDLLFSHVADLSQIESNTSNVGAPTTAYDPRSRFHQKT